MRPDPGEWRPRMPERLDEEELADWRAGRNAVYQLAALTALVVLSHTTVSAGQCCCAACSVLKVAIP
jgi:hypothetical protein